MENIYLFYLLGCLIAFIMILYKSNTDKEIQDQFKEYIHYFGQWITLFTIIISCIFLSLFSWLIVIYEFNKRKK